MISVPEAEVGSAEVKPSAGIINRFLRAEPSDTLVQLFRYLIVGGVAFAADFGALFALAQYGHLHYMWAAALAFLIGISVNYVLSRSWVFNRRSLSSSTLELLLFCAIGLVGLALNQLGMYLLTGMIGLHYLVTKIVNAGVVLVWNFGARKVILFR